jgi:hypothetical protein
MHNCVQWVLHVLAMSAAPPCPWMRESVHCPCREMKLVRYEDGTLLLDEGYEEVARMSSHKKKLRPAPGAWIKLPWPKRLGVMKKVIHRAVFVSQLQHASWCVRVLACVECLLSATHSSATVPLSMPSYLCVGSAMTCPRAGQVDSPGIAGAVQATGRGAI